MLYTEIVDKTSKKTDSKGWQINFALDIENENYKQLGPTIKNALNDLFGELPVKAEIFAPLEAEMSGYRDGKIRIGTEERDVRNKKLSIYFEDNGILDKDKINTYISILILAVWRKLQEINCPLIMQ